uniref:Inositol polyphosphate-related phosphatase domain-containing protein n=1 Tax=Kalanchoe fedtschenkoi TaxID=63787 RepID=A0A7N0TGE4_KALFE
MWPRLVANKLLRKTLGSNNFVADFPDDSHESFLSYDEAQMMKDNQQKDIAKYKIFASTWNVGGIAPPDDLVMEDWLDTQNNLCDIYVLGFQEVVPLRAANVLGADRNNISVKWNCLIRESLNKNTVESNWKGSKEYETEGAENIFQAHQLSQQEFQCVVTKQMVGIMISVWVRATLRPFISNTSVSCVGCGIMGCLGNKGSVSVRFLLHETSFCFICSHLASGGREGDQGNRNSNVSEIFSRTSFPRGPLLELPRKIIDHDHVILLGDLNYRINLPEMTTRRLVDKRDWKTLLQNDQLKMELGEGQVFKGWNEGVIDFAPTYKFYVNSDVYYGHGEGKKGEKKRAPAWCDRIIWYGKGLTQHLYTRGESRLSDHRPVKAIFTTEVAFVHRENRLLYNSSLHDRLIINDY